MTRKKPEQKLVSFTNNSVELANVTTDMQNGWSLINLVRNGSYYVGIMELRSDANVTKDSLFIPPRKKIKISR